MGDCKELDIAGTCRVYRFSTSSESSSSSASSPIQKFGTPERLELEDLSVSSLGQCLAKCLASLQMKHLPEAISSVFSSFLIFILIFSNGLGVHYESEILREEALLPNMAIFELGGCEEPKYPLSLRG